MDGRVTITNETTVTGRSPGRSWTIRLTGHPDRTATLTCSGPACRMPSRSRDLPELRRFAALHAASHAKAAQPRPYATCQCRAQQCSAHEHVKTHCGGPTVLVLRHDPAVGRVWTLSDVCSACARLMPHARIVARPQAPAPAPPVPVAREGHAAPVPARPAIAGGFSAPAGAEGDGPSDRPPAARRRPRHPRGNRVR
jgi:hypothetical protein